MPSPLLHLAPGGMGKEIFLASTRVLPSKAIEAGFEFNDSDLRPTIERLVRGE